jgi:hypothetical protein
MILKFVMWYIKRMYKMIGQDIMSIKGTGKDAPCYLLYTEKPSICERMEEF